MNELNFIENHYVKNVYEEISKHFSNTRVYTWKWIEEFIYSLKSDTFENINHY